MCANDISFHEPMASYVQKHNFLLLCRVKEIMQNDAEKDPATNPNALHARLLINQVFISLTFLLLYEF